MNDARGAGGYTLVELLIVCVLLSVFVGLAVPRMREFARASSFRYAGKRLADDLNRCAREAKEEGEEKTVVIAPGGREYLYDGEPRRLPQNVVVESVTRTDGGRPSEDSLIRFLPDGRCDPVRVVLTDKRRRAEVLNQSIGGLCTHQNLPEGPDE